MRYDRSNLHELRRMVAVEAARMIAVDGVRDFLSAKQKAAHRLGVVDDKALPRNSEVQDALHEHQRLFGGKQGPELLRLRRMAACEAMRFLADFQPRLIGAVLDGSADAHSAVCLQVFAETPELVSMFLDEHQVPYEFASRRVRLTRERSVDVPVMLFNADDQAFDLTVLPTFSLRQAPIGPFNGQPIERANLRRVEDLLLEQELAEQLGPAA